MSASRLFTPIRVGDIELSARVAMAPLTRFRASDEHVPLQPMVSEYYSQRGASPGTLLVSEATFISPQGVGYFNAPGLWRPDQLASWKQVTDAVHAQGSYIFAQLWHMGRRVTAGPAAKHGVDVIGPSAIAMPGARYVQPREMTAEEVEGTIRDYARAAKNAVEIAGFDGVEIHGANGYLIDQFLLETSNQRTDKWGGSVENRSRFAVEVARAVAEAVGPSRTAIRLSPWQRYRDIEPLDPREQFTDVARRLRSLGLAYLHLTESRVDGTASKAKEAVVASETNDFVLDVWDDASPVLLAGGFTEDNYREYIDERYPHRDVIITFGRPFISNPDLVFRLQRGLAFTPFDPATFYTAKSAQGYTDWEFSEEWRAEHPQAAVARL